MYPNSKVRCAVSVSSARIGKRGRRLACASVLSPERLRQDGLTGPVEIAPALQAEFQSNLLGMLLAQVVTLDVIGHGITLSEREAEKLRRAAAGEAPARCRRRRGPILARGATSRSF